MVLGKGWYAHRSVVVSVSGSDGRAKRSDWSLGLRSGGEIYSSISRGTGGEVMVNVSRESRYLFHKTPPSVRC